ncbi:MAG TPA: LamG-like jellyroll fold domain-containing protein [Thermoanaerobaculia bacterium]
MKPSSFTSRVVAAALTTSLALICHAQAAPRVYATASDNISPSTPERSAAGGTVTDVEGGTQPYGRTAASAQASLGTLRAFGEATVGVNNNDTYSYFGFTTASFTDDFLIDAPGLTGTPGTLTLRFTIDGALSCTAGSPEISGSSYARADFYLTKDGGNVALMKQSVDGNGEPLPLEYSGTFLGIPQTATVQFTYGTPFQIGLEIRANAVVYNHQSLDYSRYSAYARADLAHTATWGGFEAVRDAGGNAVTNYSFSSSSGTNYTQSIVPQCATPSTALRGWWPGDGNTRDIQAGNNGTLASGATYAGGQVGQAFSFASPGARVHIPHSAGLDFNSSQDYSIDFWLNAGAQPAAATLIEKNGGTYPYSIQLLPNGNIYAAANDGSSTVAVTGTGGAGFVANKVWHHIAVVFRHSTKTLQLYVDGQLNATQSYSATLGTLANGQDLYFGARAAGANSFSGLLDEVDIHGAALSLSEIQAIVAAGDLGKCRPPVALTSAASRKTHTDVGDFDINLPLTGTVGVEPRRSSTNGDHRLVLNFAAPVQSIGSVGVTAAPGASIVNTTISGSTVMVDLTGVANQQIITLSLNDVDNGAVTGNVAVSMGVLAGDGNGNGAVNSGDTAATRSRSGQLTGATNYQFDVNCDGTINTGDATVVRSRSGTAIYLSP